MWICVVTWTKKAGNMHGTGMDGIDGVVGIGMVKQFGFMGGFDDGGGFAIWNGLNWRYRHSRRWRKREGWKDYFRNYDYHSLRI
jgi:hypothetical protein